MFTLVITTLIFTYSGQAEAEAFDVVEHVSTHHIAGFENRTACEAAAVRIAGTALNVERQAICVPMAGE